MLAANVEVESTYQGQDVRDVRRYDLGYLAHPSNGLLARFSTWCDLVRGSATCDHATDTLARTYNEQNDRCIMEALTDSTIAERMSPPSRSSEEKSRSVSS